MAQAITPAAFSTFRGRVGSRNVAIVTGEGDRLEVEIEESNEEYMGKPPLKAITLHRPWAYAIAHLGKDVENRNWRCPLEPGSWLAIHAGAAWDEDGADWIHTRHRNLPLRPDAHPKGILAIAQFQGNVTDSDSPWFVGPVGWRLERTIALPHPVA